MKADDGGKVTTASHQAGLIGAVSQWPTPRSAENGNDSGSKQRQEQGMNPGLKTPPKEWPTPAARDLKGASSKPYSERGGGYEGGTTAELCGTQIPVFPPGPGELERWGAILAEYPELAPAQTVAGFRVLADELADDRTRYLRLLGNGVVPLCAAYAFCWLWCALRMGRADAERTEIINGVTEG